jgi:hypothetical protein
MFCLSELGWSGSLGTLGIRKSLALKVQQNDWRCRGEKAPDYDGLKLNHQCSELEVPSIPRIWKRARGDLPDMSKPDTKREKLERNVFGSCLFGRVSWILESGLFCVVGWQGLCSGRFDIIDWRRREH